jgi:hypothetical protein
VELGTSTLPGKYNRNPVAGSACRSGLAFAFAAFLTFGSGCTNTKFWSGDGDNKSQSSGMPFSSPTRSSSSQDILTKGAGTPTGSSVMAPYDSSLYDKFAKVPANEIVIAWRNWIDYLPDPTQGGKKGPGLAGQMFLFGPKAVPALADGTLTIDLFDETPRPPGQPANIPERYSFDRETLKSLQSTDERFGKCYILFLPWPTYRPDVTRIRITARYDTDNKKTLFAEEAKFNISPTPPDPITITNNKYVGGQGLDSLMGLSGSVAGAGLGMGLMSPGTGTPSAFGAGSMPLGMIGSQLNGAPATNMAPAVQPDPPMPISRVPVSNVPLSALQGSGAIPAGPVQSNAYAPPATENRGLTPIGGGPQGLPPIAFSATPGGR